MLPQSRRCTACRPAPPGSRSPTRRRSAGRRTPARTPTSARRRREQPAQRPADQPGGVGSAMPVSGAVRCYFDASTTATIAFRSASLAATFCDRRAAGLQHVVTSFASAPASPLYFSATEAHDGAFFVVVAVWHLRTLVGGDQVFGRTGQALPAKARAVAASVVGSSLMSVPRESVGFLTWVSTHAGSRSKVAGSASGASDADRVLIQIKSREQEDRWNFDARCCCPYSAEGMFDLIEPPRRIRNSCPGAPARRSSNAATTGSRPASSSRICRSASASRPATRSAARNGCGSGSSKVRSAASRATGASRRSVSSAARSSSTCRYEISDGVLDKVARPAVDFVSRSMMEAFVKRAGQTLSMQPAAAHRCPFAICRRGQPPRHP